MALTQILAAGTAQADSSTVGVAAGASATLSIWPATGDLPPVRRLAVVMMATNGADIPLAYLGGGDDAVSAVQVSGPVEEVFVRRLETGYSIGASKDV